MSNALLSSKTVILEEPPALRQIPGVPTSVVGVLGVTERGPVGVATRATSFDQWKKIFGGYTTLSHLPNAVEGLFEGGAQEVWTVRTAHYTDTSDPTTCTAAAATQALRTNPTSQSYGSAVSATAATFNLEPGQTCVASVNGGGNLTATFSATAASRESSGGTWVMTNGMTLTVQIDGGATQTVTFATGNFVSIGAATAAEVAAVLNASLVGARATVTNTNKVTITSDKRGTASGVNVTGGTANAVLGYTTGLTSGTGNVANIDAVTLAEVQTILAAAFTGATVTNAGGFITVRTNTIGSAGSLQIKNTTTATALGFDNALHTGADVETLDTIDAEAKTPGAFGNQLALTVANATNGVASNFNLLVLRNGAVIERFFNLTMDASSKFYAPDVLAAEAGGSDFCKFTQNVATVGLDAATARPANGTTALFTGGSDGLVDLDDNDYIGASSIHGKTGLRALDKVRTLSLLAVPGVATAAVAVATISYCETTRAGAVFAVLDAPQASSAEDVILYKDTHASLNELSEFAELHWPWVKIANPSKTVFGNAATITIPASGEILGMFCRVDVARDGGIYDPPAGTVRGLLRRVVGVDNEDSLDEEKRDLTTPRRINPINRIDGGAHYFDGTDTLKSTGNFPSIPERRGVIFIEQSVKLGLEFARHANHDDQLEADAYAAVDTFLEVQMGRGAFRSRIKSSAYWIDFGKGLNTTAVVFAQKLLGRIGLATQKPNKFNVLSFSQDTRAFDTANAAAAS